jgi:nucleosome-remodeling factor subunit BPTF
LHVWYCLFLLIVLVVNDFFVDLSMVEDRLVSNYYKTLEQFSSDITTIFDNCRLYNPKESPYYRCAEVLEGFFVKKLRSWQKKA